MNLAPPGGRPSSEGLLTLSPEEAQEVSKSTVQDKVWEIWLWLMGESPGMKNHALELKSINFIKFLTADILADT